jgi:hypothetical protein
MSFKLRPGYVYDEFCDTMVEVNPNTLVKLYETMVNLEETNGKLLNPSVNPLRIPMQVYVTYRSDNFVHSSALIDAYKNLFYHFLSSFPQNVLHVIEPSIEDTIKLHIQQMYSDTQKYVPSTPFLKKIRNNGFEFLLLDGLVFLRFNAIIKACISAYHNQSEEKIKNTMDSVLIRMIVDPLRLRLLLKNHNQITLK